jgi:hypothetical protein
MAKQALPWEVQQLSIVKQVLLLTPSTAALHHHCTISFCCKQHVTPKVDHVIPLSLELHEFIKKLNQYIKIIRDAGYELCKMGR